MSRYPAAAVFMSGVVVSASEAEAQEKAVKGIFGFGRELTNFRDPELNADISPGFLTASFTLLNFFLHYDDSVTFTRGPARAELALARLLRPDLSVLRRRENTRNSSSTKNT